MAEATPYKRKSRRPWKRWWLIAAALLLVGGGAYAFVERPWEPEAAEVQVEVLATGPISEVLAVNGRVAARHTVTARAPP
jgi:multidrug efflux pump subunit AcrA (membrane-fusion protein)